MIIENPFENPGEQGAVQKKTSRWLMVKWLLGLSISAVAILLMINNWTIVLPYIKILMGVCAGVIVCILIIGKRMYS